MKFQENLTFWNSSIEVLLGKHICIFVLYVCEKFRVVVDRKVKCDDTSLNQSLLKTSDYKGKFVGISIKFCKEQCVCNNGWYKRNVAPNFYVIGK